MDWAIVTGKVCNEALHEGGFPAKFLDHLQNIEDVAWMLSIHSGDQFATVQLCCVEDG